MKCFRLALDSSHQNWCRFNIFFTISCYNEQNTLVGFEKIINKVSQSDSLSSDKSKSFVNLKEFELEINPCKKIIIHLYIIPDSFPEDTKIESSPNFNASLSLSLDKEVLLNEEIEINQHGGYTLAGKEFSV